MVSFRFRSMKIGVNRPRCLLTSVTPMAKVRKTKAGSYELTERQSQVLNFIRMWLKVHGIPPTRSEIGHEMGLRNQSGVDNHLHALAKKKYLELKPGFERGIRLLREGVPLYEPKAFLRRSAEVGKFGRPPKEPEWLDYDRLWQIFGETPDVCMRIRCHDMEVAGLTDGGIVALRLARDEESDARDEESEEKLQDGQVVAARVGDEVILRRYHRVDERTGELQPESADPDHHPIKFVTETEDIEIIGIVIGRMLAGGG